MAVTEFTTAISGSGKTLLRCAWFLTHEWLNDPTKGKIFTNFPIHVDEMVEYVLQRNSGLVALDIRERIHLIPKEELDSWIDEKSGPWEYFKKFDISGSRIAIDEIHNFVHIGSSKQYVKCWRNWLGELRHCGCEFEAITQNDSKCSPAIKQEAGIKRTLFNGEARRDPLFGIKMYDWYNLRAGFFTGTYTFTIWEDEWYPINGKWVKSHSRKVESDPALYPLYDSYSTPIAGGTKAKGKIYEYKRLSKSRLVIWFITKNLHLFFARLVLIGILTWVCFLGGGKVLLEWWLSSTKAIASSNGTAVQTEKIEEIPNKEKTKTSEIIDKDQTNSAPDPTEKDLEKIKLQGQIDSLVIKIKELQAENTGLSSKLDDLQKQSEAQSVLVSLSPDSVTLKNGQTFYINETINFGPYQGCSIKGINYRARTVYLSDGRVLSLAR